METKYLGYLFSSVKITANCLWIWFAGIHLWIQQTKYLQCMTIFHDTLADFVLMSADVLLKNVIVLSESKEVK